MDEDLIEDDHLSLARKSQLPGTGFFYPDSLDEEYAEKRAREAVEGAEAVVVADTDADGLGCVALVRDHHDATLDAASFETSIADRVDDGRLDAAEDTEASGDTDAGPDSDERETSPVALVGASPYSLGAALERVAAYADSGVPVYVCDLCPDSYDEIEAAFEELVDHAGAVRWFDHHQWDDDIARRVRAAGVDLVVGDSDEECSTDVALRSLDGEFPDHLVSLAAVVRDHDLWIKADPRSDDLADYARWSSAEEFVAVVGEYGPDLPESVAQYLEERRVEKRRLIEVAVERADVHTVGPWTVGVTYGRCSQNEVADALREQGADAAVIVKPAGSASLRGSEGFERCHEVARLLGGGGHPRAAGCKPEIYEDMLDFAHHWTTGGSAAKRVILAAFERVAESEGNEGGADTDR